MSLLQKTLQPGTERRCIGRTDIARGALLFFQGQAGVFCCHVRGVTERGAGLDVEGLRLLPTHFSLSIDNFRTIRRCAMVWREIDLVGVRFVD